jgi:hypothetical protein
MGGGGGAVEVDEVFICTEPYAEKSKNARACHHKIIIIALADRKTGQARKFVIDELKQSTIEPALRENVSAQ